MGGWMPHRRCTEVTGFHGTRRNPTAARDEDEDASAQPSRGVDRTGPSLPHRRKVLETLWSAAVGHFSARAFRTLTFAAKTSRNYARHRSALAGPCTVAIMRLSFSGSKPRQ